MSKIKDTLDVNSENINISSHRRCLQSRLHLALFLLIGSLFFPPAAYTAETTVPPDPAPADWFETDAASVNEAEAPPSGPIAPGVGAEAPGMAPAPPTVPLDQGWEPQGPAPTTGGQVENVTPNNEVDGAIHTVVAHPTNPDVYWIGAVNGGIWKTNNATSANPTWTPLTDDFPGLSIGAMELDPGNSNVLLAGIGRFSSFGRNGGPRTGLLSSTNGGDSWSEINDPLLVGQNISGVAVRGSTMLVSSNSNSSSGVFKGTSNGASWTRISGGAGTGLPGIPVFDLVGDPGTLSRFYASVSTTGIYRSDNSGDTWTNISSGDATLNGIITDGRNNNTEMAVASNGRLYVAVLLDGQAQYIGYTDNPAVATPTWTQMDLPRTIDKAALTIGNATNTSPIRVTTTANHGFRTGDQVNITGVNGNTAANGTWFISVLSAATCGSAPNSNCFTLNGSSGNGAYTSGGSVQKYSGLNPKVKPGGQGSIHFSILVDPSSPSTVYMGGDRQDSPWPNSIGANDFSGRLFRGDTTIDPTGAVPSPQWEHLTHSNSVAAILSGGTANSSSPHADSREMVFDASGNIVEVDDGGIYRRTSPVDNTGVWTSLNSNLQVTEIHDIAYDTVSNILMGGYQDTGTSEQTSTGSKIWRTLFTADGGDVVIDTSSVAAQSTRYWSTQNLGGFSRRNCDATNSCGGTTAVGLTQLPGDNTLVPQFVTPLALNVTDETRLVIGGRFSVYESFDRGDNIVEIAGPGVSANAMVYGHTNNPDLIYTGAIDANSPANSLGVYVRTAAGGGLVPTSAPFPGGFVTDITIDPIDEDVVFVIDSSRVFVTEDGGSAWTNITGNLTAGGAGNFRTIEYIESVGYDKLVIGTNAGVFASVEPKFDTWFELGTDLPNAPVWDFDYDPIDDVLVAGTLGRGAWTFDNISDFGIPVLTIPGSVNFGDICQGGTVIKDLNACNTGTVDLIIHGIASSDSQFAVTTPSSGYPVVISPDFCFPFQVTFTPTGTGEQTATLTVTSDDPTNPEVEVSAIGWAGVPEMFATLQESGAFGEVSTADSKVLNLQVINQSSICDLEVTNLTQALISTDFSFAGPTDGLILPVVLPVGQNIDLPIRFAPSSFDPQMEMFTLITDDPDDSPLAFTVTGSSPPPDITVSGTLEFGEVCAEDVSERSVDICNVGTVNTLELTDVSLVGAGCDDFEIVGNPFPADVSHDFCVPVTVRYTPTEVGEHNACDLKITSNDPDSPMVSVPLTGTTPAPVIDVASDQGFSPTVIQPIGACSSTRPFPIQNNGSCRLTITDVGITANDTEYSLSALPSMPVLLSGGELVGDGALAAVAEPVALARQTTGELSVTYETDPITGETATVSRELCTEAVHTGARVLVTQSGVPLQSVKKIQLSRINANRNRNQLDTQDVTRNAALQTVSTSGACEGFQYHREYGTVSNPIQLLPGSYQVSVQAVINGKNKSKTVGFEVDTCDFNPTINVQF